MKLGELAPHELARRLADKGVRIRTGPFVSEIRSSIAALAPPLNLLYSDYLLADDEGFADFHVVLRRPRSLRRWFGPQVLFEFEGNATFLPLPLNQVFPMLEWGLNWCVSAHAHQFLIIHAAAVARADGLVAILPAPPGSGKSTLCAGLVSRGWRLLSDELTLLDPSTGLVHALARPISLKNASIDVMRRYAPQLVQSPAVRDTVKGTVAHVKVPSADIERVDEPAKPAWIVFPRWQANSAAQLTAHSRGQAFMGLADQSFNYITLGQQGFDTLARLIDTTSCYDFTYSQLDDAIDTFNRLPIPQ